MNFGLEVKSVIVTGVAKGIGFGVSECFGEHRVRVWGWDLKAAEISGCSVFAHAIDCGVTDEKSLDAASKATVQALGKIDIFNANSGIDGPTKRVWDYTLAEWNRVPSVDLTGVFLSTRSVIRQMLAGGTDPVVIIVPVAGKEGNPGAFADGLAKVRVIGFAKGLAQKLLLQTLRSIASRLQSLKQVCLAR